jgi:FkbM family methyltransferase
MNLLRVVKRAVKSALGRDLYVRRQISCSSEFHGSEYGGWAIATGNLNPRSIIYSVGIGTDITFDTSIIEKYGVQVFAFDPTPRSLEWLAKQSLPSQFKYFGYGLSEKDGELTFFPPKESEHVSFSVVTNHGGTAVQCQVRRLKSLTEMLGHDHIDILKIDIEGAEYETLPDIVRSGVDIKQILVEFHHRFLPDGAKATRQAIRLLNDSGYEIFNVSDSGEEFSFIRKN